MRELRIRATHGPWNACANLLSRTPACLLQHPLYTLHTLQPAKQHLPHPNTRTWQHRRIVQRAEVAQNVSGRFVGC